MMMFHTDDARSGIYSVSQTPGQAVINYVSIHVLSEDLNLSLGSTAEQEWP